MRITPDSTTQSVRSSSTTVRSRLLTEETAREITAHVRRSARGGGETSVKIVNWWIGGMRWARNRVSLGSDKTQTMVITHRRLKSAEGGAATNQTDPGSLEGMVRVAERRALWWNLEGKASEQAVTPPHFDAPATAVWSNSTYDLTGAERGKLASLLAARAEEQGLLSAGYLEIRAGIVFDATGDLEPTFRSYTHAQCSTTVRHPKGLGSGWAGLSSYDWGAIDGTALVDRALEKCIASLNPVRIEPGRYTAILEPQAVADFGQLLVETFSRVMIHHPDYNPEEGKGPYVLGSDPSLGVIRTKLGLKIVDERISVSHDPTDPQLGVLTRAGLAPVTWIDRGVLVGLNQSNGDAYLGRISYSLPELNDSVPVLDRPAFRMSGGETSIDEMIATTKRGVVVTRFSNLNVLDRDSVLATGLTRDGLWLVENGKITRPVKNMRITESPLYILNQIEQLGAPIPVYRPMLFNHYLLADIGPTPAIVPPLKVKDFSFTATVDAV